MARSIIDRMREIHWASRYKWDVHFPENSPPSPFNSFLPISDIDLDTNSANTSTLDTPMMPTDVPFGTESHRVNITFYDDEDFTFKSWIDDWYTLTNNKGQYVAALSTAARAMSIRLLGFDETKVIKNYNYLVILSGASKYTGSSNSDLAEFTQEFVIVGNTNE